METKVCSNCKEEKSISEFSKNKSRKDGLNLYCKKCVKINNFPKEYVWVETKICNVCHIEKTRDCFTKDKSRKDGLCPQCKDCRRTIKKEFYDNNKKKIRESQKEYYDNNKSEICVQKSQYRKDNSTKFKESQRKSRIKKIKRDVLKYLLKECIKRAIKNNIPFDDNEKLYNYLKPIFDKGVCECCHKQLRNYVDSGIGYGKDDAYSIDRIIPENGYTVGNVTVLCKRCNTVKNNATIAEISMIASWLMCKLKQLSQENNSERIDINVFA